MSRYEKPQDTTPKLTSRTPKQSPPQKAPQLPVETIAAEPVEKPIDTAETPLHDVQPLRTPPPKGQSAVTRRLGRQWKIRSAILSIIFALVVLVTVNPRMPTAITITVVAKSVSFTAANNAPAAFLTPRSRLRSLSFAPFQEARFSAGAQWQMADLREYNVAEDSYPAAAWSKMSAPATVTISGENEPIGQQIVFGGSRPSDAPFSVDPIWVTKSDNVTLATDIGSSAGFSLLISGRHQDCRIVPLSPFQVTTVDCRTTGLVGSLASSSAMQSAQYRIDPTSSQDGIGAVQIAGMPTSIGLHLKLPESRYSDLFSDQAIPVSKVEFSTLDGHSGNTVSTLSQATIAYPDQPKSAPVLLAESDFLILGKLHNFRIDHVALQPGGELAVTMDGTADDIEAGAMPNPRDIRLTMLDMVNSTPYAAALGVFSSLLAIIAIVYQQVSKHVKHIKGEPGSDGTTEEITK